MKEHLFNQSAWRALQKRKLQLTEQRQRLNLLAQDLLRSSKRAIFALQRHEIPIAEERYAHADGLVKNGMAMTAKSAFLHAEGTWRAALEEYAEAWIFRSFMQGSIDVPRGLEPYPDAVYGGLSDAAGEIARMVVLRATEGDRAFVDRSQRAVSAIVEMLADLDATGSLRTKFDQSKQHLRRIEDIRYDLSKRL